MDKLEKILRKLTPDDRLRIKKVIEMILAGQGDQLDFIPIKGDDNLYRVRVGDLRIIYRGKGNEIRIVHIARRNEKTYRDL